jgi:hypothetical protein
MSKRDTTTKVRALEDLEKWVRAQPEDDESGSAACQEAIGPWIKLYIKLTTDVDRRVRLMTNNVHLLLVKRVKKKLAPYLKEVIAAWIGTFFDPTRDVARVAMEAFKVCCALFLLLRQLIMHSLQVAQSAMIYPFSSLCLPFPSHLGLMHRALSLTTSESRWYRSACRI